MSDESIPSLIKELSKSLLDPTLLKRYGTNLNPSMSLDYEKYLMKRYNELKQEFIRINKNIEDALTSYDKAISLKNDYAEPRFNRGNLLLEASTVISKLTFPLNIDKLSVIVAIILYVNKIKCFKILCLKLIN